MGGSYRDKGYLRNHGCRYKATTEQIAQYLHGSVQQLSVVQSGGLHQSEDRLLHVPTEVPFEVLDEVGSGNQAVLLGDLLSLGGGPVG